MYEKEAFNISELDFYSREIALWVYRWSPSYCALWTIEIWERDRYGAATIQSHFGQLIANFGKVSDCTATKWKARVSTSMEKCCRKRDETISINNRSNRCFASEARMNERKDYSSNVKKSKIKIVRHVLISNLITTISI